MAIRGIYPTVLVINCPVVGDGSVILRGIDLLCFELNLSLFGKIGQNMV